MGLADYKYLLDTANAMTTAEYSTDEVDFGFAGPGYNQSNQFGCHFVVTTTFTGLAEGIVLWIVHATTTAPTIKHTGMFVPVASLIAGAHFFVPCGSVKLLQFVRAYKEPVSSAAVLGAFTTWLGPHDGQL